MFRGKLSACEQDEGHMEDAFDYGDFAMDVLKEDELDTSLLFIVRRIIVAPKVEKVDWRRTSIFQILVHCGNQAKCNVCTIFLD